MQDRYTGDIGDFGKYAMLKALAGHDLRLGVVWYLNPDEEGNGDGMFVAYPRLRECDPQLHDSLACIVAGGGRRVNSVERVLPGETIFYPAPLTFRDLPAYASSERRSRRAAWVRDALAHTAGCDLIFMDPDNGIAGRSAVATSNTGQKYVFLDEIRAFVARDQSVIIYHHQTRERGGLVQQIDRRLAELQSLKTGGAPWALVFRRQSVRVYFVLPARRHAAVLAERGLGLIETLWGRRGHFEIYGVPEYATRT